MSHTDPTTRNVHTGHVKYDEAAAAERQARIERAAESTGLTVEQVTEAADAIDAEASKAARDQAQARTTYGMRAGFDYDFQFSDAFPIPSAYVVAYGMAHFRGPDGHLWFAPDCGSSRPGGIDWNHPQNVAEFDQRMCAPSYPDDPEYGEALAELCSEVDAAIATSGRYIALAGRPAAAQ
jgi:hypothetical protein